MTYICLDRGGGRGGRGRGRRERGEEEGQEGREGEGEGRGGRERGEGEGGGEGRKRVEERKGNTKERKTGIPLQLGTVHSGIENITYILANIVLAHRLCALCSLS